MLAYIHFVFNCGHKQMNRFFPSVTIMLTQVIILYKELSTWKIIFYYENIPSFLEISLQLEGNNMMVGVHSYIRIS